MFDNTTFLQEMQDFFQIVIDFSPGVCYYFYAHVCVKRKKCL